jgi:hypothetical protein
VRALVKVKFDSRFKEHYVWYSARLDDSFTYHIVEWLDFLSVRASTLQKVHTTLFPS